MSQMPIVYGNVDLNGNIQVSSDNFNVTKESKGIYQISYDPALSFDYPPCVIVTGVSHELSEKTRSATIQANSKDDFQVYFKNTSGELQNCGFNFAVFYESK